MKTYLKFSLGCMILATSGMTEVYAQNAADALRYSYLNIPGSARSLATGGAFGAVGADYSSSTLNPAGLGLFRKSEFTASFSTFNTRTKTVFLLNPAEDTKQNSNIPQMGLVFSNIKRENRKAKTEGWVNTTFALGFVRTNNFNSSSYFEGINNRNSIADFFAQQAYGQSHEVINNSSHTMEGLAYWTFLIDPNGPNNQYSRMFRDTSISIRQSNFQETSGRMSDWNLSYAANYSNFFYVGGTITYSRISYTENVSYQESDVANTTDTLQSLTLNKYLKTTGGGLNVKLGVIVKPADNLRAGLSYQLPTVYSLNDEYSMDLTSVFDTWVYGKTFYSEKSPDGYYNYRITTPSRLTASVAYIIGEQGFISLDYESVDYTNANLNASDFSFNDANNDIRTQYKKAGNVRIGGEWKFDIFSFRAGYVRSGSPYKYSEKYTGSIGSRNSLTLGAGIREKAFFLDLAMVNTWYKDFTTPYTLNPPHITYSSANSHYHKNLVLSGGLKF